MKAEAAAPLRASIANLDKGHGRRPIVACLQEEIDAEAVIGDKTVYRPELELTVVEFGVLIFLELQALKAVAEVEPIPPTPDDA